MIVGYKVKMRTILVTVVMLTMEKYIYSNQNGGKIGNTDSNGSHVVGLALCCWAWLLLWRIANGYHIFIERGTYTSQGYLFTSK